MLADLQQVESQVGINYFANIKFTDDPIDKIIFHLSNQYMQALNNKNIDAINDYNWSLVRLLKGFVHEENEDEDEEFWWNENLIDNVSAFNILNNECLGKILAVDKIITNEIANKLMLAGWYYIAHNYAASMNAIDEKKEMHELCIDKIQSMKIPLIQTTDFLNKSIRACLECNKARGENNQAINWTDFIKDRDIGIFHLQKLMEIVHQNK